MSSNNLSSGSLLFLGFVLMAGISVILTFKQARAVDAMGDVAKVNIKIKKLSQELGDEDLSDGKREKLNEKMKKLREEDLPAQRLDAQSAMAAMPNGAILWTFLSQVGAAVFGLGVLGVFMRSEENPVVRSTALVVIGGIALTFILSRVAYLVIGGGSGLGSAL